MAELLKGIEVVKAMSASMEQEIARLRARGVAPCLAIVRAGARDDDIAYENGIARRCEKLGIDLRRVTLSENVDTATAISAIEDLNADASVQGVLVMRPLPKQIDDRAVCRTLDPAKDLDGITDSSMAAVYAGLPGAFAPCTAEACVALLVHYGIELTGKNVTVIGRSLVIGKPLVMLLLARNATVTVCHTRTQNLAGICRHAEIVVAAAGAPRMVGADFLAAGQIVIDVGIHDDGVGGLCGDVDFAEAEPLVSAITPVPGGVGTVTAAVLCRHLIDAAMRQN